MLASCTRLPRKGKLREGVGREVADRGIGQELHHLKIWKKVKVGFLMEGKRGVKVNLMIFKCECK